MNATNRAANRALLLVVGMLLAAAGGIAVLATIPAPWAQDVWADVSAGSVQFAATIDEWAGSVTAGPVSNTVLIGLIFGVVPLVVLVVFVMTRGGGRTSTVLRVGADAGIIDVDTNIAEAVLADSLARRPDVLAARLRVYRVKGAPAIKLTVTPRRGTSLPRVLHAADDAVAEWDALVGIEVPIVLHLADRSWRERWRSASRVQ